MSRIEALNEILSVDPANQLARYGLAMEYANAGQVDQALTEFKSLLASHPDYPAAYFMAGQTLAKANRTAEATEWLTNGIAAAHRKRDSHAAAEMQAFLDDLSA